MRLPRLIYLYPSALLHLLWSFTAGLFSAKSRARIARLGYEAPWFQTPELERVTLPKVSQEEIIGHPAQVLLHEPACVSGNVSIIELTVLTRLIEETRPENIFEFGTFNGRSALNMIAAAPANAHLYTLDLPASMVDETKFEVAPCDLAYINKPVSGNYFTNTEYAKRITQLYGDSANFDFSPYIGQMDTVFIDASHAYEYVRCDTLNALKLLRSTGGLIVWHDYASYWPGVVRALNEFFQADSRFRALKNVDETTLIILKVSQNIM